MTNLKMTKTLRVLATAVALLGVSAAQATTFDYTYTFLNGSSTVSGKFDGIVNGDIISDLSNIFMAIDGNAVADSGQLSASHLDYALSEWVPGGGFLSFSGNNNNFLINNTNFGAGSTNGINTYFGSLSNGVGGSMGFLYNSTSFDYVYDDVLNSSWSITTLTPTAAIPEPGIMALVGAALLGLALVRRKSKA